MKKNKEELLKDKTEILRLARIVHPSSSDIDSIYNLYKKFINQSAPFPKGCNSCQTNIAAYWRNLIDWYNKNMNYFD